MTIQREAKVRIGIDVKSESKDAAKLLETLREIDSLQERIKRNSQAGVSGPQGASSVAPPMPSANIMDSIKNAIGAFFQGIQGGGLPPIGPSGYAMVGHNRPGVFASSTPLSGRYAAPAADVTKSMAISGPEAAPTKSMAASGGATIASSTVTVGGTVDVRVMNWPTGSQAVDLMKPPSAEAKPAHTAPASGGGSGINTRELTLSAMRLDVGGVAGSIEALAPVLAMLGATAIGLEKAMGLASHAADVMTNHHMLASEKMRALTESVVPLSGTFFRLVDSTTGVNARMRQNIDEMVENRTGIQARGPVRLAIANRAIQNIALTSQAQSVGLYHPQAAQIFNRSTPLGEVRSVEQARLLTARDEILHADRAHDAANTALRSQDIRVRSAQQNLAVQRRLLDAATRERQRAGTGTPGMMDFATANSIGSAFGLGPGTNIVGALLSQPNPMAAGTDRANRAWAARHELEAVDRVRNAEQVLAQEQQARLAAANRLEETRNQTVQARLSLQRQELANITAQANRMISSAEGFGGLGRGGRRQAVRAFERVRRMEAAGRGESISAQQLGLARSFDAEGTRAIQRRIGEQALRREASRGRGSDLLQHDFRAGGPSIQDIQGSQDRLAEQVRQGVLASSRERDENLARIFTEALFAADAQQKATIETRIREAMAQMTLGWASQNS